MASDFERRVHNRFASIANKDLQQGYIDARNAIDAVLDKCEQMRAESAGHGGAGVGHFIAAEFEQTIADALGINN